MNFLAVLVTVTIGAFAGELLRRSDCLGILGRRSGEDRGEVIRAEHGVVAADDARCSAIGTDVLREGGHAVDAAVATALCLGVVSPMSSGIGGGAFLMVRSSADGEALAYDMRETAPGAAYQVNFRPSLHLSDDIGSHPFIFQPDLVIDRSQLLESHPWSSWTAGLTPALLPAVENSFLK